MEATVPGWHILISLFHHLSVLFYFVGLLKQAIHLFHETVQHSCYNMTSFAGCLYACPSQVTGFQIVFFTSLWTTRMRIISFGTGMYRPGSTEIPCFWYLRELLPFYDQHAIGYMSLFHLQSAEASISGYESGSEASKPHSTQSPQQVEKKTIYYTSQMKIQMRG